MGTATGFCILGPALAVVGLKGDIKRGIISTEKGRSEGDLYMYFSEGERNRERATESILQWSVWSVLKKGARLH